MKNKEPFELFKYIIEQETKDGKEFVLMMHNSTTIFPPIKKKIQLNDEKDEIIMTVHDNPQPSFPFTTILKKEGNGNNGIIPNEILEGELFESLNEEGYLLKYKDELNQQKLL